MIKKATLTGLTVIWNVFRRRKFDFSAKPRPLSGENFWQAISGFVLSGVGICHSTLVIGALNPKGYVYEISIKIAPWFATLYLVALYLSIGPFFAIPRTATVAYEVGVAPMLPASFSATGFDYFYSDLFYCGLFDCVKSIQNSRQYRSYFDPDFLLYLSYC